jgi:hypothetical protein
LFTPLESVTSDVSQMRTPERLRLDEVGAASAASGQRLTEGIINVHVIPTTMFQNTSINWTPKYLDRKLIYVLNTSQLSYG